MTKTEKALRLLETGGWITSTQLVEAGCGYRFGGRLQDLRNKGYIIEKKRVKDTLWAYRLAGDSPQGGELSEAPERNQVGGGPEQGDSPPPPPLFGDMPEFPSIRPGSRMIDPDQRED